MIEPGPMLMGSACGKGLHSKVRREMSISLAQDEKQVDSGKDAAH